MAVTAAVAAMLASLPVLRDDRDQLEKDIIALHTAQITGITEAARVKAAAGLQSMFGDMRQQVEYTRRELDTLGVEIVALMQLTRPLPQAIDGLLDSLDTLEQSLGGGVAPLDQSSRSASMGLTREARHEGSRVMAAESAMIVTRLISTNDLEELSVERDVLATIMHCLRCAIDGEQWANFAWRLGDVIEPLYR